MKKKLHTVQFNVPISSMIQSELDCGEVQRLNGVHIVKIHHHGSTQSPEIKNEPDQYVFRGDSNDKFDAERP